MNLRHLECFLAVAHHGHFGRAAQALHISAPALSKTIRKLEAHLGVVLVDRADVNRLTGAGAVLLPAAEAAVAAAESAYAVAAALRREQDATVVAGFVPGFVGAASRPILDRLAVAEPGVALMLTELPLAEQSDAVRTHRVDVSFVRGPVRSHPDLRFDPVLREPRLLAVPRSHPLADRGRVRLTDFAAEPMVRLSPDLVDEAWARWWAVDPRPDGSPVRYGPTITTVLEFLEVIAAGRGVGITTPSLVRELTRPDLAWPVIDDVPPSEVFLCTRREVPSRYVGALRRVCADVGPDYL